MRKIIQLCTDGFYFVTEGSSNIKCTIIMKVIIINGVIIMKYNVSLPPLPKFKMLAWKEREQQAVIIDLKNSQKIFYIETSFVKSCWSDLPEAVYYHARNGRYRVFGLADYDKCSGTMTFYGKDWKTRPEEMSKIIPNGAGARSLGFMPNEMAVLILQDGYLYKAGRNDAKVKMTIPLAARAVFAGQNIYAVKGKVVKEYSPKGFYLKTISPALTWAAAINSGAVNYTAGTIIVGSETGRMAIINKDDGGKLAEGVFNDGGFAGFMIAGYNGELLIAASTGAKKIYWLDMDFKEVASIDYSKIIPGTLLFNFDGRDLLALSKTDGTLYTLNIQDNWEYAGVVYTASEKPAEDLPPKLLDIDNINIFYCEYDWHKDRVKSVIGYLDSSKKAVDIMFDGLLMMVQTHNGKSLMGDRPAAGLPEWNWYLDILMNAGGRYELIETAAGEIQAEANRPDFKPKVFIGIPYPMDSLERYQWFIDQCIYGSAKYGHVVLAGFYYTEEFSPDSHCNKIKKYILSKGLKYIWSPGYPAKIHIKRNNSLFDAIFYQTGYPWGYFTSAKGKEHQLTLALVNIVKLGLYPNVESMNDTRWFTFIRDKIYTLWDILLNYGVYSTTKLHFTGDSQVPESCFSANPFERQLYDLYHEFLRGRRSPGMAKPLYNRENDYSLTLPKEIIADKIRIMPRFTRNPPHKKTRTLVLKKFNIPAED
ncbi:MAG: DUF4855 domain-containing protein [Firmicutes bacterium]|nr:DUF4855 domain-containing protein [Bacillota bacterium]